MLYIDDSKLSECMVMYRASEFLIEEQGIVNII